MISDAERMCKTAQDAQENAEIEKRYAKILKDIERLAKTGMYHTTIHISKPEIIEKLIDNGFVVAQSGFDSRNYIVSWGGAIVQRM